jgi:hypothetical protein
MEEETELSLKDYPLYLAGWEKISRRMIKNME